MNPQVRALRSWSFGLLVTAGVLALSAVLTPPIHALLEGFGWLGSETAADRHHYFLKVLRRIVMVLGILAVAVLLKPWQDGGLGSYGLRAPERRRAYWKRASLVTLAAALLLLGLHAVQGWLQLEDPLRGTKILKRAVSWGARSLGLAFLEELFFRGWLWRRLAKGMGVVRAALVSSAFFGVIHAFRPSNFKGTVSLDATGALDALAAWGALALDPDRFLPAAFGLFLLGLVLCMAWRRTGSLWTAIAIHATGMAVVYIHPSITNRFPKETWAGSGALFDGPPGWILLGLALLVLWRDPGSWSSAPAAATKT